MTFMTECVNTHLEGSCKIQEIRGVFKKRPKFLNSMATSKESALWLRAHPVSGFENKLPFVPFCYEH